MHQRRRLQRLARLLLSHPLGRQPPQLVVDQRQQLLRGRRVARLDGRQDARHLTHRLAPVGMAPGLLATYWPGPPASRATLDRAGTERGGLRGRASILVICVRGRRVVWHWEFHPGVPGPWSAAVKVWLVGKTAW